MTTSRIGTAAALASLALAGCSSSAADAPPAPETLHDDARAAAGQVTEHLRTHGELPDDVAEIDVDLAEDVEIREFDPLEPFRFCLVHVPTGAWVTYSDSQDEVINQGAGAACLS